MLILARPNPQASTAQRGPKDEKGPTRGQAGNKAAQAPRALGTRPEAAGEEAGAVSLLSSSPDPVSQRSHAEFLGNTPCPEGWAVWAAFSVIKFLT